MRRWASVALSLALAALLLVALSPAVPAHAADRPARAVTKAAVAKAKRLFEQGETLYRLGKFRAALSRYRAALSLARRPSLVVNIAQCHRQLGESERAVFYYKLYLADWARAHPDKPPPYAREVRAHIARLSRAIGAARQKVARREAARREAARRRRARERGRKAPAASVTARTEPASAPRSTPWLVSGITTGVVAAAAGAVGLALNLRANQQIRTSDAFARDRAASITMYAVGGAALVASVVSFVMFYRSGAETARTGIAVAPAPGGGAFVARLVF